MGDALDIAVIGSGVAGLTAAHVLSAPPPRHPLRGRRPARRARRHPRPRRRRAEAGSTPASSCTTSAPTRPCCGCSPSSACARRSRTCRLSVALRAAAGSSTPARAGCRRPAAGRRARPARVPADARRGAALPPARPRALLARARRPTRPDARASSWPTAASRATSPTTSCCRSSPRCGRRAPTTIARLTRPATCSASSPTTACSRSPDSPQWRTVVGGCRELRRARVAERLDRGRRRRPRCARSSDRRRASRSATATTPPSTGVVVATHPDQALALLADPTAAERDAAGRVPVLRATTRCCTPTPRCCRARPARGRRGTTCSTPARRAGRACT